MEEWKRPRGRGATLYNIIVANHRIRVPIGTSARVPGSRPRIPKPMHAARPADPNEHLLLPERDGGVPPTRGWDPLHVACPAPRAAHGGPWAT